jgi:hypothetical protein
MKNSFLILAVTFLLYLTASNESFGQSVKLGPRLSGNFNIYNENGQTGTWNGIGIGIGGNVDVSFSKHIGILVNLTVFDMKNFSNSTTTGTTTDEFAHTLSFLTIDPMFKAEFSGFYMVGGPSLGIKLAGSGEFTRTTTGGGQPQIAPIPSKYKSVRFDIAVGTGYNFRLSSGLSMGTDFMAYIPLTSVFDAPGLSNSLFSLKLGVALKFDI